MGLIERSFLYVHPTCLTAHPLLLPLLPLVDPFPDSQVEYVYYTIYGVSALASFSSWTPNTVSHKKSDLEMDTNKQDGFRRDVAPLLLCTSYYVRSSCIPLDESLISGPLFFLQPFIAFFAGRSERGTNSCFLSTS